MPGLVCPKCGSGRTRRSHTRGVSEKLNKILGWRAYRCREKSCGWRGLIKTKSFRQEIENALTNRQKQILILILVVAVISIGTYLAIYLSKHQPPPLP
jgi:hypothetical protein